MSDQHTRYVTWGFNVTTSRVPIKLESGSLRECNAESKRRTGEGWRCAVYRKGDAPVGLRLLADQQGDARCWNCIKGRHAAHDVPGCVCCEPDAAWRTGRSS